MTIQTKARLVDETRERFGVSAALRALSLPRSTYYYQSGRQSYEAMRTCALISKRLRAQVRSTGIGVRLPS